MPHTPVYRPLALLVALATFLPFLTLGLVLALSWNSLQLLLPLHDLLDEIKTLQEISSRAQAGMADGRNLDAVAHTRQLADMSAALDEQLPDLAAGDAALSPAALARLAGVRQMLDESAARPRDTLVSALEQIHTVVTGELRSGEKLLTSVRRVNRLELLIAAMTIVVLPILAFATLRSFRRRVLSPLKSLEILLAAWAEKRFEEVSLAGVDPLLVPLFEHYNQIVGKLDQIEKEHRNRQQELEQQVEDAARTLLEQQRQLADADRLAAVGEVTAVLAHELRNPLASIRMALNNLRRSVTDGTQCERLDMIIGELQRMTRYLNGMLEQARQHQESAVDLDVNGCIDSLLELIRYQVPERIRLLQVTPLGLRCRLPESRLRQALLNLVLNAARSIGERSGTVRVSGHLDRCLHIEVQDDGPGFPASLLRDGVRSFGTLAEGGTGLGLSTVRRFAQDMGGTLRLENRGGGACATLELPRHANG